MTNKTSETKEELKYNDIRTRVTYTVIIESGRIYSVDNYNAFSVNDTIYFGRIAGKDIIELVQTNKTFRKGVIVHKEVHEFGNYYVHPNNSSNQETNNHGYRYYAK